MNRGFTLYEYVLFYIKKTTNIRLYNAEDIRSDVFVTLLMKEQLRHYVEMNEIPQDKKLLSFLKAIISRTKLRYINKENVVATGFRSKNFYQLFNEVLSGLNIMQDECFDRDWLREQEERDLKIDKILSPKVII